MQKIKTINTMLEAGALAIVRTPSLERAAEIAKGCIDGGIPVMEMSYTLSNAGDIIEGLKQMFGDSLCVGGGTILDSETARLAILKGAEFIIAPNFDKDVALLCNRYQIPYAPGCSSLSEAVEAMSYGASFVKAFPISDFYGPKLVKVFKTPIPNMPILASGGINLDNVLEYVDYGTELCGFGGLLTNGSSDEIAANARLIREKLDSRK